MRRKKKVLRFTVILESCEEGGYFAYCPSFQGCHVEGESIEETLREMRSAILAFIAEYKKDGVAVPEGDITVTSLKVAV